MEMGESHDEERGMDTGESHDGLPDPGPEGSDEQGSHHLVDWEETALGRGGTGTRPRARRGPPVLGIPGEGRAPVRNGPPALFLDLGDSSLSGPGRGPGRGAPTLGIPGPRGPPAALDSVAGMDLESPIFFEASRFPKKENAVCR